MESKLHLDHSEAIEITSTHISSYYGYYAVSNFTHITAMKSLSAIQVYSAIQGDHMAYM